MAFRSTLVAAVRVFSPSSPKAFNSSFRFSRWCSSSSSSGAPSQLVRAPIQVFGREGRYAHALYSAASKENALDKMEGDLKTISDSFQKEPALKSFLMNPSVQRKEKIEVTREIVEKSSVSPLVKNLFVVMAENGALHVSDKVIAAFVAIMSAQRKEVVVIVTTAKKLSASQESKVNAALGKFLQKGEVVKMEKRVDESLLGGMTVIIGDKFIDMSLAKKIKKYTDLISQPI